MLMRVASGIVLLATLAGGPGNLRAGEADAAVDRRRDELFGEHERYRAFLIELQSAAAAGARERVADFVAIRSRVG
jgi:hypothetical protein